MSTINRRAVRLKPRTSNTGAPSSTRAATFVGVKVDWTVQIFQLTAAQQALLDHRPQLASSPEEIIAALQLVHPDGNSPSQAME